MSFKNSDFFGFLLPCHTFLSCSLNPLVTPQKVTNFGVTTSRLLMQILSLNFAEMCIFSIHKYHPDVQLHQIVDKTMLLQLINQIQADWWNNISLFRSDLIPSMSHFIIILTNYPPPRWVTYFLNGPRGEGGIWVLSDRYVQLKFKRVK